MKLQLGWLAVLAATQLPTCAAIASANLTLADVPRCGLACTATTVPASECMSMQNTTCMCTSQSLSMALAECVSRSCTVREALVVRRFADISCGRMSVDKTRTSSQAIMSVFTGLATLFFILRILARWQSGFQASWNADDWLISPAVIVLLVNHAYAIIGTTKGFNRDIWWLTPDDIDELLHSYFVAMLIYFITVSFTKLSVLAFYLQIFPGRTFRNWTFGLMACNAGFMVSITLATTFQCWPVRGAWTAWDGTFEGKCFSLTPLVWAGAILTIVLDAATLILPMPALWKLNMTVKKRLQIMLMFGIGAFVTITSMIRLRYIAVVASTINPSRDYQPVGIWSIIELSVGIMCACLPAVRALLVRVMPRVLSFSTNRSAATKYADGMASSDAARHPSATKVASAKSGSNSREDRQPFTPGKGPTGKIRSTVSGNGGGGGGDGGMTFKTDYVARARRRDENSFIELDDMSDVDHASLDKDDVVLVGPAVVLDKDIP